MMNNESRSPVADSEQITYQRPEGGRPPHTSNGCAMFKCPDLRSAMWSQPLMIELFLSLRRIMVRLYKSFSHDDSPLGSRVITSLCTQQVCPGLLIHRLVSIGDGGASS